MSVESIANGSPQVVYVKDTSSGTSKFIDQAMAPVVLKSGTIGMVGGIFVGAGKALMTGNNTWVLAGAVGGTMLGAGSAALLSKGLQIAADVVVNTSVYAMKLPFKATYAAVNLTYQGISAVYQAVMGTPEISDASEPAKSLEIDQKKA
ncbi:MAG: hypothetical protein S4CHLAM6_12830 [Chlamydiae bacterium]|nr:hypothetical protein [Chlamydiota bacterium]